MNERIEKLAREVMNRLTRNHPNTGTEILAAVSAALEEAYNAGYVKGNEDAEASLTREEPEPEPATVFVVRDDAGNYIAKEGYGRTTDRVRAHEFATSEEARDSYTRETDHYYESETRGS